MVRNSTQLADIGTALRQVNDGVSEREDAARYRWLRAQGEAQVLLDNGGGWFVRQAPLPPDGDALDAAIDAAMRDER